MPTEDATELDIRHGDVATTPAEEAPTEEPATDLPPDTDIAIASAPEISAIPEAPTVTATPPAVSTAKEKSYPLPSPEVSQMAPPPPPAE